MFLIKKGRLADTQYLEVTVRGPILRSMEIHVRGNDCVSGELLFQPVEVFALKFSGQSLLKP